jgi:uncharacterized OB-fold protein
MKIAVMENLFVEAEERKKLLANKCKFCGQIFFPKAIFCTKCFKEDMESVELSNRGKLYSYTIGHMASLHFEPPYAVGYIDMPEGVRIFGPLKIMKDQTFRIGMEMKVVIEKLWNEDDKEVVGYKFEPV